MSGIVQTGSLAQENAAIVTIASGVATIQQGGVILAAESSTSDDLDRIILGSNFTGLGSYGVFLMLTADTGDTITLKNGTYIKLSGGADFALSGNRHVWGWHDGTNFYDLTAAVSAGSGTVTSVGLSTNASYLTIGSTPVTTSGTITANKTTGLTANQVVATPDGAPGAADLRALVAADIPNLAASKITSGQLALARGGTNADLSATGGTAQFLKQSSAGAAITVGTIAATDLPTTITLAQINDTNGNEEIIFTATGSAVNELTIANAATGNNPNISASGGDTNVGITLTPKGTGAVAVAGKQTITGNADAVQLQITANGTQSNAIQTWRNSSGNILTQVNFGGGMVINEQGNDSDTRIEGDTNTNLFVADASADSIGIGTATPSAKTILDVVSTTQASRPFPTMDSTQRDAIASPATASVIYNSTTAQYEYYTGVAWAALSGSSGTVPPLYKAGLRISKQTAAILEVGIGAITVDSTLVSKTATTLLTMSTNGDWIGGMSLEAASTYVSVYADASGNLKLYNALPNYPRANTASRVADARVNQAGWNGTSGSGLNATSIVYDTDTGEGNIAAGMLLGVYSDSAFTTGRGRGSGASASVNNASFALITAVNTSTNTITVAAGHNIAINDNDYLIAIEYGSLEYINVSATWYRFIGRMYNNSSSDLDDNRLTKRAFYSLNEASNYSISGTSFASVDSTLLKMDILTSGGDIRAEFIGSALSGSNYMYFTFAIDGVAPSDDGVMVTFNADIGTANSIPTSRQTAVLPGTHTADLQAKVIAGGMTLYAGAGTANLDIHPEMRVYEVQVQ